LTGDGIASCRLAPLDDAEALGGRAADRSSENLGYEDDLEKYFGAEHTGTFTDSVIVAFVIATSELIARVEKSRDSGRKSR